MTAGANQLQDYARRIEELAVRLGLDFYPVDFELVPDNFMTEIAVYGLPVRMPHWSFGIRYIHQLIQQGMGHSRIFEVMFPGDPCHAYLVNGNSLPENTLVVAHVLGHADFAKNNHLFRKFMEMAGGHILEQAAARAHAIEMALERHGQEKVEAVLDAALALEPHIDVQSELHRSASAAMPRRSEPTAPGIAALVAASSGDDFRRRYHQLPGETMQLALEPMTPRSPSSATPLEEYDLLWFIAKHAPDMAGWERDIFLAVREESFYFYPVFACQIMNEGWASYWHARLLREADFLPQDLYLSAIKAHSDVVRPYAAERQLALSINPYHLGFSMWEYIIEKQGLEAARRICREEDDFGFIRNYLDAELARKLDLFVYATHTEGDIRVASRDIHAIREAILAPKFNYGAPRIAVTGIEQDGSLELTHDHRSDGSGLDMARADRVLEYIARVWRRPVNLHTVDERGYARDISSKRKYM
ncbi:SpoVR family protein [Noviherbaspirillum sedimenti]|uniref:Stage V sporulation protein R n=1 Tax=Noviherbaspirillum sedimenti TaxID=2320865 RepID=A0A3A3FY25_9BURK|nr:SpoVR family protein [Noviherbaspirillum sedimenti]RJG01093.1 stage V sporulation protein R [Noviherbaspirillum sedimenti]